MEHKHWIRGAECPLPNCYTRYEIPGYREVWALSIYTQADFFGHTEKSELGQLVHDLKYEDPPLSSSDVRIQKITDFTSKFINEMLPRDLDWIITVPANRAGTKSMPKLVARALKDRGHSKGFESLQLIAPVRTLKSITVFEERLKEVLGAYEFSKPFDEKVQKNVLVLDDVIESGSTFRAAETAIHEKWPSANVYGVAFTFVKDFRVKP